MGDGRSDVGYVSFLVCDWGKAILRWCFGICFDMVFFYMLWYGDLVYVLIWCLGICLSVCFGDISIGTYVYGCKHCHELCFKAPISVMGFMSLRLPCCYIFMLLCYHVVMLSCGLALSRVIIVNIASSYVIKLHEQYFFSQWFCWGICVIEHWGWCPPRGRVL